MTLEFVLHQLCNITAQIFKDASVKIFPHSVVDIEVLKGLYPVQQSLDFAFGPSTPTAAGRATGPNS